MSTNARRASAPMASHCWLRWTVLGVLFLPQAVNSSNIPVSGACTLVDAIDAANNDDDSGGKCPPGGSGSDTLTLTNDVTLTAVNNIFVGGETGLPVIMTDVIVDGGGFTIERDTAAAEFRIFGVDASGSLSLNNLSVRNGSASTEIYDGGGDLIG